VYRYFTDALPRKKSRFLLILSLLLAVVYLTSSEIDGILFLMKDNDSISKNGLVSKGLITVEAETPLAQAIELMKKHRIRHLPVTVAGSVVGIVSDRDVQRLFRVEFGDFNLLDANKGLSSTLLQSRVGDVMSWPVKTVSESATFKEVVGRLHAERLSALLVVDDNDANVAVGIVTTDDVLKALLLNLEKAASSGSSLSPNVESPWIYEIYQSPIGRLLAGLSNSGI